MGKTSISPSFSTETRFWDTRPQIVFHRRGSPREFYFQFWPGGGRRLRAKLFGDPHVAKMTSHRHQGGHLYPANVSSRLSGGWGGLGKENQDFEILEIREIRVRKIRISGGWGDLGGDNKDFWRFGRSGYGKQRFLEAGEIRVRKIKIFGGWGNPGRKMKISSGGLGRSG